MSAPTGHAGADRAVALDPRHYLDPADFERDLTDVLASGWQAVAPADRVRGPGDVVAREIGRVPIAIARTPAGELRGFVNVCAHRAGPVVARDARGTKRLRCAYHGWTYDHEGRLRTASEMDGARDFDRDTVRLRPVDVVEWRGLVWARAGDGIAFERLIDGVDAIVGQAHGEPLVHRHSAIYDVAANWKVYVDNYLEGYHLPFVHPDLTRVVDYKRYTTELGDGWSLQRSPVDASDAYGEGEGLYFFIHPNTMLNYMPGRLQTNRVVPTGLASCRVEFDFYYAPGAEARADDDLAFSDQIQEEDCRICEQVQRGLASGAYAPGRLSPERELGVWHWHEWLRRAYASAGEESR